MSHYLHAMRTGTRSFTIVLALFGSVAFTACGSSDNNGGADGAVVSFADAGTDGVDATIIAACNPVENTGCGPGEKCSVLNQTDTLRRTTCVPDGTVPRDGVCAFGDPGPSTGYDDCEAKSYCRNNVCREICDSAPDSCTSGNCVQIFNTFDEIDGVGICAAPCHPVTQDCAVDNEGCYLNTGLGTSSCSRVPEETAGLGQEDDCYGPEGGDGCFLNGCPAGFAPILNKGGPDGPGGSVCTAFCTPVAQTAQDNDPSLLGGVAPHTCGARGALSAECRFIQSFYSNTDLVDVSVGMCVPADQWGGSCANHDPANPTDPLALPGCEPLPPAAAQRAKLKLPKFTGDLSQFNMSLPKK